MKKSLLLRVSGVLAFAGVVSCADSIPVEPSSFLARKSAMAVTSAPSDLNVELSSLLSDLNGQLAARGVNLRIAKAELLLDAAEADAKSATLIVANDRARSFGVEWVKGDPRRGGRVGVNYAVTAGMGALKVMPRGLPAPTFPPFTLAEVDARIEEGMAAWRDIGCSSKPIVRQNEIAPNTNPDLIDDVVFFDLDEPPEDWVPPADIVQAGWLPSSWFRTYSPTLGNSIIGVTFTFAFVDAAGNQTDIDGNGMDDTGLAEVYYSARFVWSVPVVPGLVDFYSIITHETGHALGLPHFGKLFVTKKDVGPSIPVSALHYAPKAMMNAVYISGVQNVLAGTDNSMFCSIWAGND